MAIPSKTSNSPPSRRLRERRPHQLPKVSLNTYRAKRRAANIKTSRSPAIKPADDDNNTGATDGEQTAIQPDPTQIAVSHHLSRSSSAPRLVPLAGTSNPQPNVDPSQWSQLILLLIGPTAQEFIVHKHILTRVDWFRACLRAPMREAASGVISMPESDADAFNEVIHWLYSGNLSYDLVRLCRDGQNSGDAQLHHELGCKANQIVQIYLLAKMLGMEVLQNLVIDATLASLEYCSAGHRYSMIMLGTENDDLLRQGILQHMAVFTLRHGWELMARKHAYTYYIQHDFGRLREFTEAMVKYRSKDYPYRGDRCLWHSHTQSEACPPPVLTYPAVVRRNGVAVPWHPAARP